jgi:outer membrane cobalamin receptor
LLFIQPPVNGVLLEQLNNYNDVTHLDYQAKMGDRLTFQPMFEYTRNNSWSFDHPAAILGNFISSGSKLYRYRGEMSATYDAPWSAQMRLGGGHIRDEVDSVGADGTPGLQLSADPADIATRTHTSSNFGLFQYMQQLQAVGVTLGGRYENTTFGNAFAPRAGLTYVHEAFNAKLLYGRAFRIPLPWQAFSRNAAFAGNLVPETADTTEMELGYKFSPHLRGKINVFFIDIKNPIVYQGATNAYVNFGRIQSEGAEAELRTDFAHYGGFANISYATPGPNTSAVFVTQSKKQFLASPPIKINLGTYYRAGKFELAPSITYLSRRAGQSEDSAADFSETHETTTDYHPLLLANMNIVARNVVKDLDVHLSVHNMFDARYVLIQPYYGDHAPMPAQDRQITLGVTWRL